MKQTGLEISEKYKETAPGELAVSFTACEFIVEVAKLCVAKADKICFHAQGECA